MTTELDLSLPDGRRLRVHDTGPGGNELLTVFWHHGTPNTGDPPQPLIPAAGGPAIRWISVDRPGYGGSTVQSGRSIASIAADAAFAASAVGVERFAVMGHSGGGPHALACAALLPNRVVASVIVSGLAPFHADELEWWAGMAPAGAAELRAAADGASTLRAHLTANEFDGSVFTPADHAALAGPWRWLGQVAAKGTSAGLEGMVDDDVAYVSEWGFDPASISTPVLLLHGTDDRIVPLAHTEWMDGHLQRAELWRRPGDGHLSVLNSAERALEWLRTIARP